MRHTPTIKQDWANYWERRDRSNRRCAWALFIAYVLLTVIGMAWALDALAEGEVIDQYTTASRPIACTPPTTREDGALLPADQIAGYFLYVTPQPDPAPDLQPVNADPLPCPILLDLSALPLGQQYAVMKTQDTAGRLSRYSDPFPFELTTSAPPLPPVVTGFVD